MPQARRRIHGHELKTGINHENNKKFLIAIYIYFHLW